MGFVDFLKNKMVWYIGAALLVVGCAVYWYKGNIRAAKKDGQAEVVAVVAKATGQAIEKQLQTNSTASTDFAKSAAETKTKVEYRTVEIIKYVNQSKNDAVACPADADFIGLYNNSRGRAATETVP
jgi:hypothetical protein